LGKHAYWNGELPLIFVVGIVAGRHDSADKDPLSGVIICPGLKGTAVKAELLGLPQYIYIRLPGKSTVGCRDVPNEKGIRWDRSGTTVKKNAVSISVFSRAAPSTKACTRGNLEPDLHLLQEIFVHLRQLKLLTVV
jgi:hypothetical protein